MEQAVLGLKKVRTADKVWEMRSNISGKFSDRQFVGVRRPENGVLTASRDETYDVTLTYNYNLLRKNDVENESEENRAQRELKEFAIRHAMELDSFDDDDELTLKDFEEVVKKIKLNNRIRYLSTLAQLARPIFLYSLFSQRL